MGGLKLRGLYVVSVVAIAQAGLRLAEAFGAPISLEQEAAVLVFVALIAGVFLPASPKPPEIPPQ
jgi:hypothetical protein